MSRIRVQRIAEQIKKELAELLRMELKDPRLGFVTVTRVEVAGDLQHVKAFVSVFGNEEEKRQTLAALERAAGFLRGEITRRLHLRLAPELVFRLDESGEHSSRIEALLKELRKEETGLGAQAPEQAVESDEA
jgi:ribosome-binding factor A